MNEKELNDRRDGRRTQYKFLLYLVALGIFIGGPFQYFAYDRLDPIYASLALLAVGTVIFVIFELRDRWKRKELQRSLPTSTQLRALDHLCYVIECAALGYTGEGKGELADLCRRFESNGDYSTIPDSMDISAKLMASLECFRAGDREKGISLLSQTSRRLWASVGA